MFLLLPNRGRLPITWYPQDFTKIPMTNMRMGSESKSVYPERTYRFYILGMASAIQPILTRPSLSAAISFTSISSQLLACMKTHMLNWNPREEDRRGKDFCKNMKNTWFD